MNDSDIVLLHAGEVMSLLLRHDAADYRRAAGQGGLHPYYREACLRLAEAVEGIRAGHRLLPPDGG